ncbi:MAG: 2-oxo acid dehydrogenase subunit E2 [Candidatus Heimdallarchaeaceae archaeon]
MGKKDKDNFEILKISNIRKAASEVYINLEKKHNVHALLDFDITETRNKIRKHFEKTGEKLSFSAFIINCVGKAVSDNKRVHAMRKKRRKLVVFNEVDIATIVERDIEGESWPILYVIRSVDKKPLREIHKEIRNAQVAKEITDDFQKLVEAYLKFPRFLRLFYRKRIQNNPEVLKSYAGSVLITSVGITALNGGWGIPYVGHPLVITIGGIEKKAKVIKDKIEIRECLNVTVTVDHDNLDGAPAARFAAEIKELIENGYGLEEIVN